MEMNKDHIAAHDRSSYHRDEILASEQCGCFYCGEIFAPSNIMGWIDDEQTAMCPFCGIDSVIGSKSGYPVTADFLDKMNEYWFQTTIKYEEIK